MNENSSPLASATIKDWLNYSTATFKTAEIDSARLDSLVLLENSIGRERSWLLAHSELILSDITSSNLLIEHIQRRAKREPLAYITGRKEFYGRDFIVTPAVLIPRPETEDSIHTIKKYGKTAKTLLDVGTGSGAIAITAALELTQLKVTACDVSSDALVVAKQNNSLSDDRVNFVVSDLLLGVTGQFDIIVANLPYVDKIWDRSAETAFEPALALFANNGGLDLIDKLILQAADRLNTNGYLILEADPCQHDQIKKTGANNSLQLIEINGYCLTLQKT